MTNKEKAYGVGAFLLGNAAVIFAIFGAAGRGFVAAETKDIREKVVQLELSFTRIEVMYGEILRRLDRKEGP